MKFGPQPLEAAVGKVMAHNLSDEQGKRLLRKGTVLTEDDIEKLRGLGRERVYVAELEPQDIAEDEAARRIAQAIAGEGIELSGATTGRTNLLARVQGVLRIDEAGLREVNDIEGVTLATLRSPTVVPPRQMVATVKIIPYALPETSVSRLDAVTSESGPLVRILPLTERRVALILHGSRRVEERLRGDFVSPLRDRVEAWGSHLEPVVFIPFESAQDEIDLEHSLGRVIERGAQLILIAGETAIMDRDDVIPRSILRAGGSIESVGAPVDPGNLLMIAYLQGVPILGAPGCARSRKENVIDWIIPRLLVEERVGRQDLIGLGHGGLLAEIRSRPMPRQAEGD
jgi:hypothetical protein